MGLLERILEYSAVLENTGTETPEEALEAMLAAFVPSRDIEEVRQSAGRQVAELVADDEDPFSRIFSGVKNFPGIDRETRDAIFQAIAQDMTRFTEMLSNNPSVSVEEVIERYKPQTH